MARDVLSLRHDRHRSATTSAIAGRIEVLPSGSLRVMVFAGQDPLTKRWLYLRKIIPSRDVPEQVDEQQLPRPQAHLTVSASIRSVPHERDVRVIVAIARRTDSVGNRGWIWWLEVRPKLAG